MTRSRRRLRWPGVFLNCPECREVRVLRIAPHLYHAARSLPDETPLVREDCDSRILRNGRTKTLCGGQLVLTAGDVRRAFLRAA